MMATFSFFIDGNPAELEAYVFDGQGIHLSEADWKDRLGLERYQVMRDRGTERPFSGSLYTNHDSGLYQCGACGLPLFQSDAKYESGSGWPSFFRPIEKPGEPSRIKEHRDTSLGMVRIEILCARCGSHLGHVFPDGPAPTGLRYCVNSASLGFVGRKPR